MGSGWKKTERRLRLAQIGETWLGTSEDFPSILVSGSDFEDVRARTINAIHEMSFDTYITPEYKALQTAMHESCIDYGMSARAYITPVLELIKSHDFKTVLDYGCGKGALRALIFGREGIEMANRIKEYDPAIPGMDALPEPADLVVCIDVLEHIEPETLDAAANRVIPGKLDSVLAHIRQLSLKMFFCTVSTVPATKILADGRNAHLIVQPQDFWLHALSESWDMRAFSGTETGFVFIGVPR